MSFAFPDCNLKTRDSGGFCLFFERSEDLGDRCGVQKNVEYSFRQDCQSRQFGI